MKYHLLAISIDNETNEVGQRNRFLKLEPKAKVEQHSGLLKFPINTHLA
jgi:hypothetical protein